MEVRLSESSIFGTNFGWDEPIDCWQKIEVFQNLQMEKVEIRTRIQSFVVALTERGTTLAKGEVLRNHQRTVRWVFPKIVVPQNGW